MCYTTVVRKTEVSAFSARKTAWSNCRATRVLPQQKLSKSYPFPPCHLLIKMLLRIEAQIRQENGVKTWHSPLWWMGDSEQNKVPWVAVWVNATAPTSAAVITHMQASYCTWTLQWVKQMFFPVMPQHKAYLALPFPLSYRSWRKIVLLTPRGLTNGDGESPSVFEVTTSDLAVIQ